MVGHFGKADTLTNGMDAVVAGEIVFLVQVPKLAADVPHRDRAEEDQRFISNPVSVPVLEAERSVSKPSR